jgi:hypothetical protein
MKKLFEKLKYLLPLIGSFLGALGGQGVKEWRRVVLPIILSTIGALSLWSWWGILLGTFGIWVSMGYGIPDATDTGSTLGRFWYNILNQNHFLTDIFTRGTIGFGMCLSGLVIPILKSNWLMYAIGCLLIMIGQTVFSYRGWGYIEFQGKELLWSDLINYFLIFLGYLLMLI